MWPRARTTVMMPPSTLGLFASFFSRRSLLEPLQKLPRALPNLPRALPSLLSSPTALALTVGASLIDQPDQNLEVTIPGCSTGRSSIPRTALAPRPAQDVQVTMLGCVITNIRVPRAGRVLSPHPLEHFKVTTLGCSTGRSSIPRTALAPRPAQDLQVTMKSSVMNNPTVPRTGRVLSPHPLEHLKATATSSTSTRPGTPRTTLRPQPLQHLKMAMTSSETTSLLVPQLTELSIWPLAPVLLKHLEVAMASCDIENSLHDFRIGVVLIELPAPVRTPVLRKVGHSETTSSEVVRSRHELPARPHLRLSQLLGHQSEGAHVVLIELPRDDRPRPRRKPNLFLFPLRSFAPGLELRVPQLQPLDLITKCLDQGGRVAGLDLRDLQLLDLQAKCLDRGGLGVGALPPSPLLEDHGARSPRSPSPRLGRSPSPDPTRWFPSS